MRNQFVQEMTIFLRQWENSRDRALLLRYEDLIERPEQTLEAIFEHLRIDASARTTSYVLDTARRLTPDFQQRHRTTPDEGASIGRWRRDLDDSLRVACEESLGDALGRLGYA